MIPSYSHQYPYDTPSLRGLSVQTALLERSLEGSTNTDHGERPDVQNEQYTENREFTK